MLDNVQFVAVNQVGDHPAVGSVRLVSEFRASNYRDLAPGEVVAVPPDETDVDREIRKKIAKNLENRRLMPASGPATRPHFYSNSATAKQTNPRDASNASDALRAQIAEIMKTDGRQTELDNQALISRLQQQRADTRNKLLRDREAAQSDIASQIQEALLGAFQKIATLPGGSAGTSPSEQPAMPAIPITPATAPTSSPGEASAIRRRRNS